MRRFHCSCGQALFFDSVVCERCNRPVGFAPDLGRMVALHDEGDGRYATLDTDAPPGLRYRYCNNGGLHGICNGLAVTDDTMDLCVACRLNRVVPDVGRPANLERWSRLEAAKRRLLYSLSVLGLPVAGKGDEPQSGLAFDFMEDQRSNPDVPQAFVATGHADGVITVNVMEADPAQQVIARERLNEQYRTLLGHMRHESGHYFWDRLVRDSGFLRGFRGLFGDERGDYAAAMDAYYQNGAAPDWNEAFISAYASAHPWEDWAETWAHYLHMLDTLETAKAYGIVGEAVGDGSPHSFEDGVGEWMHLSVVLNELNRSMGQDDSYPFVVPPRVVDKLRFVHEVVQANRAGE